MLLFPWRQTCLWLMFFCFTSIVKTNSSLWRNSIHKCCLYTYSKYTFIMKSSFLGHFNESKKTIFSKYLFLLIHHFWILQNNTIKIMCKKGINKHMLERVLHKESYEQLKHTPYQNINNSFRGNYDYLQSQNCLLPL